MRSKNCGKSIFGIEFIRLLPNAQAVISVKGYCRVVEQPSGKVRYELVDREFAHGMVAETEIGREERGYWYEAVDYEMGKTLNFDCRGLSADWEERMYQIHHFDKWHEGENTFKRYRKIYHRAKGFKLGRLLPGPARSTGKSVKLFKPAKADRRKFRSAS